VRVLGVDPGLSRCGVGVVEGPLARPVVVRAGVVRTAAADPPARRLAALYRELRVVLADSRPDAVAVEWVFFNSNARTAMGVGQAAGVALLCAEQAGIPVAEYTPTQVKVAVTGTGGADKDQIGFMVRALLGLVDAPGPSDAADALALALCHLQRHPRVAAAAAAARPGAQVSRRAPGAPGDPGGSG
jgi:crossover junction endodeoxyribonuclease RuvC